MPNYNISEIQKDFLARIIENTEIRGSDADKVLLLSKSLEESKDKEVINISDDVTKFVLQTLDECVIRGKFASILVQLKLALLNPVKSIKKTKSRKKS
jgi:hypothetical protein